MPRYKLIAGAATLALGLVAIQQSANAAVTQVAVKQELSATPITFSFGAASFSFTLDNSGSFPMSAISSSPTGLVTTFFGAPADFFADAPIDGNGLFGFTAYATPTSIPSSSALDFIGFSYAGVGGTHYGFAEVFGSTFVGYAYETAANTTIFTQQVPEPASAALVMGGLTMVGLVRKKKRNKQSVVAA